MKPRIPFALLSLWIGSVFFLTAQEPTSTSTPQQILTRALQKIVTVVEPANGTPSPAFRAEIHFDKVEGLPKQLAGQTATLAFQAPDHLQLTARYKNETYALGRDGQQLWMHVAGKKWGVVGQPGQPRFLTATNKVDNTKLGPLRLPLTRDQLLLAPLLMTVEAGEDATIDGIRCREIRATPKPETIQAFKVPQGELRLWIRESDDLPVRLGWSDGKSVNVDITLKDVKLETTVPDDVWHIPSKEGDRIETTALGHLARFLSVTFGNLGRKIPSIGPGTGERQIVATEGKGRFERIDGTRLLYLEGTPEEIGHQHGVLLKKEINDVTDRILYGVGVGSSFPKGRWFFGEIEEAQRRIGPFIDPRYLEEMDAIATAVGREKEEIRLANFFPELFHCSGFAIFGHATKDGRLYHGRVLDYLRGVGLEQNAVVIVTKPDQGNAWVNVSYAGFVGSVTAMNEKKVAIGEMGGRGEGNWDGKPMAQLVREVMEKANTLEEAVAILRKGPRTCEYYYVISDGKTKRAVGIAATPEKLETVWPGEKHERLPESVQDAVLLSAGDRYTKLVERVRAGHGTIDDAGARDLMRRPVCMDSNIHSVLFAPETLDFWVANADSANPASHTRFTHYNLAELLKPVPAPEKTAGSASVSR
jgi:outer membrane lipoprotein-sorting protein